jgi:hypothetical protein
MKKNITIITALTISFMLLAANGFTDIPAPPVNQLLGMPDGIFNNLVEADCRACHVNPVNLDRHHLLYGTPIIYGECSVNGNTCLTDTDCDPLICESYGTDCSDDTDCYVKNRETCGEVCVGETAASNPLANTSIYDCLSCHDQGTTSGEINFIIYRDCLVCHYQVPGEASVHHLTGTAQGTNSPLGDPTRGDCTPCHGTLVDDFGDGADIPTYEPTEQTPTVQDGTGEPLNSEGNGAGACDYCHSSGTGSNAPGTDTETGILVYNSGVTHHSSGVYRSRTGAINSNNCSLCHGDGHVVNNIRDCEQCHGYESLHNIQADSNGDGEIFEEDNGYGHIGTGYSGPGRDCWGCHGFAFNAAATSAPGTGPITPTLSGSDKQSIVAGKMHFITLTGESLINKIEDTEFRSVAIFTLTAQDGSVEMLKWAWVENSEATVLILEDKPAGNYKLRAVKGKGYTWSSSNPVSISIKDPIVIGYRAVEASCGECSGELTIFGSGFGDKPPAGTEEYINVLQNNVPLNITAWGDWVINATGAACDGSKITVNGLFGSATK